MVLRLAQLFRIHHAHTNTRSLSNAKAVIGKILVSSPWLTPADSPKPSAIPQHSHRSNTPPSGLLADYGVTRLEAEPQEGPTEYKLHLLLRPRRNYSSSSTLMAPSYQHEEQQGLDGSQPTINDSGSVTAYPKRQRQNRLEQLTTQLLWRLQQSSPHHTSSAKNVVMPKLPEAPGSLENLARPSKLLVGLEESRGALYEIGVSDDGAFVGLTKDEMDESLTNLRAMAASLGCNVEVVRMVAVGDCEWLESTNVKRDVESLQGNSPGRKNRKSKLSTNSFGSSLPEDTNPLLDDNDIQDDNHNSEPLRHQAQLWVAEALVTPDLRLRKSKPQIGSSNSHADNRPETHSPAVESECIPESHVSIQTTEQLRITLTGPTTSGKSSLLGTLSTGTLDNGRGKSRLSLLKHRHEIASGVTSSVAQELIGYKLSRAINYASGNVSSWTDIHASAENGRLVFVSDSAGHPRYRRTTVRGLVGWAPHWTVLCIGADDGENAPIGAGRTSSAQEVLGTAGAGIDLAKAHLELCLKLEKPLAIVITKLDLASRTSLRLTLSKVLTAVKAAGRKPSVLPPDKTKTIIDSDLTSIPDRDVETVGEVVRKIHDSESFTSIVPIIMTSSAKGTGIRLMHALLRGLPIPRAPTAHDFTGPALNPEQPASLFHIEDVFGVPASYKNVAYNRIQQTDSGSVVAGHMRFGRISVGDAIVIGPFPSEAEENESLPRKSEARSAPNSFGPLLSNPSSTELARIASRNIVAASVTQGEWHNAHVVSIRNLRLPVQTLEAGQVGTIGIVFDLPDEELSNDPLEREPWTPPRIRKGLVIAIPSRHMIQTSHTLQAASGFTASFEDSDINSVTPGSLVVVYIASIRASARALRLVPHAVSRDDVGIDIEDGDDVFGLEALDKEESEAEPPVFGLDGATDVAFELMTLRWWIELGSQVLVMPGGGHGLYYGSERGEKGVAGLEGFVGKVIEVVD